MPSEKKHSKVKDTGNQYFIVFPQCLPMLKKKKKIHVLRCLTCYYTSNFRLAILKKLQMTVSNLTKMVESSPDRVEKAVEKGDVAR